MKIFGQNLTPWDGNFGHFQGQKSHFLAFFKVFLELFRKCLGIVLVLKRHTFGCIYTSKCCWIAGILSFGVPRMPYNAKNPQDFYLGMVKALDENVKGT